LYLRVNEVGRIDFDGADVYVDELLRIGPTAEDEGTSLNAPRPIGVVQGAKGSR